MRLLLDTHALIWFVSGDPRMSLAARDAMNRSSETILVSAVSAMEVTTKHRLGKLPEAALLAADFEREIEALGFEGLPLSVGAAEYAGRLAFAHKDPFDRLLIGQAIVGSLTLVSNEQVFDQTGVARLW